MRRGSPILILILLVLGVLFVLWDRAPEAGPDGLTPGPTSAAEPGDESGGTTAPTVPGGRDLGPTAEAQASRTEIESAAADATAAAPAACIVVGRVLDNLGEPIADAHVRLAGHKLWADGLDLPRLAGRYDRRGFDSTTDAEGRFRFEAPVPTVPRTFLEVRPDRFHDSHTLRFDSERAGEQPALGAGLRDLGDIRLATTGAVRGRITDAAGRPLEDVELDIGPSRSTTYSRDAWTDSEGRYLIAHAPIGTYAVKAKLEGYLSGYLEPITVEGGLDTAEVDFVLASAPTLEGLVVDERDLPIEGARLWGWPASSGAGAGADSGADGRFVMHLPQVEPYSLSAKREGYRSWGERGSKAELFEPGTRDIRIVLESLPLTRFRVVDADSGQPIERFGLNILEDNGSESTVMISTERRPPTQRTHADGIAEATARTGVDLFVIAAEGYLLAADDVAHDTPDEPLQTVRMRRGAVVRGRVLGPGGPLPETLVEIQRGWTDGEGSFHGDDNSRHTTRTGADGRFELDALERGQQRVTVRPIDAAPLVVGPFELAHQAQHDLGDLQLMPGASVAGRVLLPPDVEPAGLDVYLDDWRDGVKVLVDGEGAFRFDDLAAGTHQLTLDGRPGVLADSRPVTIELAPGETRTVTLDARDRAVCQVTLTIDLAGQPATGVQVDLLAADGSNERKSLGNCDEQGRVVGSVRAWGAAKVGIWMSGSGFVAHPDVRLDLQPRAELEQVVSFAFASLELTLPAGLALPESGRLELRFDHHEPGRSAQFVSLRISDGSLVNAAPGAAPGALVFGGLLAGRATLTVELVDRSTEWVRIATEDGGFRLEQPSPYSSTHEVLLVAGERLELGLH